MFKKHLNKDAELLTKNQDTYRAGFGSVSAGNNELKSLDVFNEPLTNNIVEAGLCDR